MPRIHTPARRRLAAAVFGTSLLAAPVLAVPATAAPLAQGAVASTPQGDAQVAQKFEDGRYFVVLKGQPSVTYRGGVAGFAPTAASEGSQFRVDRPEVAKYEQHLRAEQGAVASTVDADAGMQFSRAINAFVAELSADQALQLTKDDRVMAVVKDEQAKPDYTSTEFLGLPGTDGTWNSTYGGVANAGKGVVVGVIDSGIYPDSPYLDGDPVQALSGSPVMGEPYKTSDGRTAVLKADGTTAYADCETGEGFPADSCTDKLIGAYAFSEDFEDFVPVDERDPNERISPLGVFSHGTHTATTIVGNAGVKQNIDGADFGEGSGVAPAASLIAYKICWEDTDPDTGGCYTSASVAAIEKAIENNVDVINYSISGNNTSVVDPVALAFRSAAEAGIFVSASAGNSGTAANTVNHSSPWVTTVAASTFSNELTGTVEFSDGTKVRGASSTRTGVGPAEVVHATEVAAAGASAEDARLCKPGSLSAAAAGKIILCERGGNARTEKSEVVKAAGGVGMILVNTAPGSLDADFHAVPTVHTNDASIIAKVKASDLTATIVAKDTTGLPEEPLPQVAGFSSRGPSNAVDQEFLKPDVAAPGVNVIAGVSPLDPGYHGNEFGLMSGTSMAAPNVAGMAALMAGKHPDWSPMAVKSAMMTTATDMYRADGSVDTDNFATGAGEADPKAMANPGLVYESDARQWDSMLLGDIGARDVNVASVAIPDVVGSATVTRTLTATQAGTWTFRGNVPGFKVTASPSTVSLAAGQSAEVKLTFARTDAKLSSWTHGSMSWLRPGAQSVTSPVTLKAIPAQVTSHVEGQGSSGSATVEINPGVTGELNASVVGLAKADQEEVTKTPGDLSVTESPSTAVRDVEVGADVEAATFAVNAGTEQADWDMYVFTPSGELVSAATAESSESVTIESPEAGTYTVIATLFDNVGGGSDTATLETLEMTGDAGNLTVTPDPVPVVSGMETEAELAWSGLTEGVWRGLVTWAPGVTTTVTVTVGAGGTPVDPDPETCEVADFSDNPVGSQYYGAVRWMQCEGITTGYADNTYRKAADISRGESLAFMYRYLDPEFTAPATSPFMDVRAGSTFYEAITWAASAGVTKGYTDGTFKPNEDVSRDEFAAFVFRAVGDKSFQVPAESPFTDLLPGQTHYQAITWMESEGLLKGYRDGSFGMGKSITRGEVAVIMERVDAMMQEG